MLQDLGGSETQMLIGQNRGHQLPVWAAKTARRLTVRFALLASASQSTPLLVCRAALLIASYSLYNGNNRQSLVENAQHPDEQSRKT